MRISKILLLAAAIAVLPPSCGKKEYSVKGNSVIVKLQIPGQAGNDGGIYPTSSDTYPDPRA